MFGCMRNCAEGETLRAWNCRQFETTCLEAEEPYRAQTVLTVDMTR